MEEKNTNNKNKILNAVIGDTDKWKKLPDAFNELKEEMKTNKKWILIFWFLLYASISFLIMYGVGWFQDNAQYCDVLEDIKGQGIIEYGTLPIPEGNHSWAYYLEYYKTGRKQTWVYFNCSWDLNRFWKELKEKGK